MVVPRGSGAEPPAASTKAVLSGCEFDYSPFSVIRDGQQADGFSVALLRASLRAMGRDVTFKAGPWAEIKQDLAEGRLEALPMVARTPERESTFDFTFPYLTMHGTIVVRADTTSIDGPEDLRDRRVAVLEEDVAHEYLRRASLGAVIVPVASFATALKELSAGKHDAVVVQKLLAFRIMREAGLTNLRTVGPPLSGYRQVLCFAVRKGNHALLNVLNEGLSIVMANGTYRRLHAEWFSSLEALGRSRNRILVGGDTNYPPYEFLDANGQPAGFNVDLTRAIARRMGLSVDIRLRPWAKVREDVGRRRLDVVQGMFYSAERDRAFDFSPPHTVVQHVIVVRKGSTQPLSDLKALAGRSILVMAGDIMHDVAIQQGLEKQLVPVPSQEEALRRLAAGQHDCALVARVPALFWIEKYGWKNLEVGRQPVASPEYSYAVHDGDEALLSAFSDGLTAIKSTGEYRAIQTRWLGAYEQPRLGAWAIARYGLIGSLPVIALLIGALLWSHSLRRLVRRRTSDLQRETQALRESEKRLHEADQRFRLALRNAPVSVAAQDQALRYIWSYNQKTARPEEIIGHRDEEIFTPEEAARVTAIKRRVLEEGVELRDQMWLDRPGGRMFLDICWEPIRDEVGRVTGVASAAVDLTPIKQVEEQLKRALAEAEEGRRTLQALMEHVPEGITIADENLSIRMASRYGQDLLGLPHDQLPSVETAVFHPDGETPMDYQDLPLVRAVRRGETVRDAELVQAVSKGPRLHLLCNAAPIRGGQGQILGAVVAWRDITERKKMEVALRQANASLAAADQRKNEFLAVLSHELRNPLAPIKNSLYVLERAAPGGDQATRALAVVARQTDQLARLVDDLLDVTRITRNKVRLQRQRLELNELVRRTVEDQRSIFERNGVRLELEPCPSSVFVMADGARLSQVVSNLLQNAAKFTTRGGRVRVSASTDPTSRRAVLCVADTGVGMKPETVAQLFEPFMQADQSLDRSRGGLGLGLALVKGLVELHGGEVSAHSEGLGKGATFTLKLPLAEDVAVAATAAPVVADRPVRRVLIIDDNVDAADSLCDVLELGDHEVAVAHDGPEGIERARSFHPDIVLCDIGLPGMDGYGVARAFRADHRLKHIFLVALSGYALPEDLLRASEAGFDRHLAKPACPGKLEELLTSLPPLRASATSGD